MEYAAPVKFLFVGAIKTVALGKKKLQRSGMRVRKKVTYSPGGLKRSLRFSPSQAIINPERLLFEINGGIEIRQMEKLSGGQHRHCTIYVQRQKPNSRYSIEVNISSDIELMKRA